MSKAISGYWKLSKKYGIIKAIKYFYSWYYGQFKQRNVDLSKERIINVKNGCKLYVISNDPGISLELSRFGIHEPVTTQIVKEKIKRMLGEYIMSRYILTQNRETMYRVIAYNCYRITRNNLVTWGWFLHG